MATNPDKTAAELKLRAAAQTLLTAHDALVATADSEPDADTAPRSWLSWHAETYEPAYAAWKTALREFRTLKPWRDAGTGSHPWAFRPQCRAVLGQDMIPGVDGPERVEESAQ